MHLQTTSFGVLSERVCNSWMRQFNVLLFNDTGWGRGNKIIFEGFFSSNKSPDEYNVKGQKMWVPKCIPKSNVAQPHDPPKTVAQKIFSMLHQPDVEMTSWAVPASDLLSNGPMLRRHHVVDCCGRSGHVGSCKIHTERIERWTSTKKECKMCREIQDSIWFSDC